MGTNPLKMLFQLQIIHYNLKYGSFDEALFHEDGLAAFAFLFKVNTNFWENYLNVLIILLFSYFMNLQWMEIQVNKALVDCR